MKKAFTVLLSAVMTLMCASTALAAVINHNINDGDLIIGSEGNTNTYVVTGSSSSSHKIVVSGASTTITLQNVTIEADGDSALDIGDDASVELVISGSNQLSVTGDDEKAAIHVSGGSLVISGSDADTDVLTTVNRSSDGAAIGSSKNEDFTGTITIKGGVTVNAETSSGDTDGAGIGSGKYGDMSGTITVNEGSVVHAAAEDYGAGIGSGESGFMSGNIVINGGEVHAESGYYGAGIGAGDMGNTHLSGGMTGNITINGGTVEAYSVYGTGIGAGDFGDMSGTITISGGTVTTGTDNGDVGIGAGENMSGTITISGGTVNITDANVGIGGGQAATGNIVIGKGADITMEEGAAIGTVSDFGGTLSVAPGAVINGVKISDAESLEKAGVLNGSINVKVGSKSTYSLGKLNIVSRIKSAKAGDTVYVYESQLSKGKLPYYVLEELAKTDGITLAVVSESGETAEFKAENIPEKGRNAFLTVNELIQFSKA